MERGVQDRLSSETGIRELVAEANRDLYQDRRASTRYPFVRQVSLKMPGAPKCTAFTREISAGGIGLLQNVEMTPGEIVELSIPSQRGYSFCIRVRVVWCHACGKGWFVSGGQFVDNAFVTM